jgi:omega-hydroxy-beta-dihydromenaquinone-9 sulfotransferase
MIVQTNESPIFFIGMARSGTTLLFEPFARHEQLAWPSNYSDMAPARPSLNLLRMLHDNRFFFLSGKKKQYGKVIPGNRYLVAPYEAYAFWNHYAGIDFSGGFLAHQQADEEARGRIRRAVTEVMQYQFKERFCAKLTGPPRITYLKSVFPHARFIHVIRNGMAVVHSLLNVRFWKEKGGYENPFWKGSFPEEYLQVWNEHGRDPAVLVGLQWRYVIELARSEGQELGPGQYMESRYEDFVRDPHGNLLKWYEFCGLEDSAKAHRSIDKGVQIRNMNGKYLSEWGEDEQKTLSKVMSPVLQELGYA